MSYEMNIKRVNGRFFIYFFSFLLIFLLFLLFQSFAHTHAHYTHTYEHTFIVHDFDLISTLDTVVYGCYSIIIEIVWLGRLLTASTTTTTTTAAFANKPIYNSKFQQFINQIELNMNISLAS